MLFYKAQVYGIFIISILLSICFIQIKKKSKADKLFIMDLICGIINLLFDIASNYTVNHLDAVSPMVNRIVHIGFFVSLATMFMLVYRYLVSQIENEIDRTLKGRMMTIMPYFVVVLLVTVLPIYYMETPVGNYSYGPGPNTIYVCGFTYMFLVIALMIKHSKHMSVKNKVATAMALASVLGASIFQLFNPTALTSSLGVTLFCLCMYTTVANPDAALVRLLKKETARADAANRAKSEFLAKMSHEIRTPINAIMGMNEMILRESEDVETRKYAYNVKNSANTLLYLVNEILDSAKIESGKMEIIEVNYDIGTMLNDLYNMIAIKAADKELELEFNIDTNIPSEYFGDDIRIKQILMNLMTNAVKYTHTGKVSLTISADAKGDEAILRCSVKDTGIGIKEDDIRKLFVKYQRIEEFRNRDIEGTGLGMNIVVSLLALMGSELKVKSVYGEGSEFYFDIKQKIINADPLGDFQKSFHRTEDSVGEIIDYIAPEAKVLVVDDNDMNRKVFISLMKKSQINVFEANSGAACIEMVQNQKFNIIFLDYMMPEMNGIETLNVLRENKLCDGIPVIMLTANAVTGAREECMKAGFNDYLSKPILPDKLDKMIMEYLPHNLLIKGKNIEVSKQREVDLPELDEFDFEYALRILNSEELVWKMLVDFHSYLSNIGDKLNNMITNISDSEVLGLYRIEVHALKSAAATVGALLLSKVARLSEMAAIAGDCERLRILHPILMEEIVKHRERLHSVMPQQEVGKQIDNIVEIKEYLNTLTSSLQNDDFASADFLCGELQKYKYSDNIQLLMDELANKVMNLESEDAIIIIWEIMKEFEV